MRNNYVSIQSNKSKQVAMIMCAIGGLFGLHYFYVGRVGKGLLKLVTLNFMTIGWFKDIVMISSGNFKDKYGNRLV